VQVEPAVVRTGHQAVGGRRKFYDRLADGVVAFARAQFALNALEGEGGLKATHRAHLESLARGGDLEAEAELAAIPSLPRLGAHLWSYFSELHQTRSLNGMAVARLTRQEIRQWEADEGHVLERWERRVVMAIDAAFVASLSADIPAERQEA